MAVTWQFALIPAAGLMCWLAVGRVLPWLQARAILDRPNARSAHRVPVPRGGGIGLMAALLPALAILWLTQPTGHWRYLLVFAAALILAAISWMDDRRTIAPLPRLTIHCLAAAIAVIALPPEALVLQGVAPLWLDRVLAALAMIYFVNIFNFMDGIDGISGVETVCIGVGAAVVAGLGAPLALLPVEALILAAIALGWLLWNWHPAKLFLGDVGSVPLGFLLGWLLLRLAADGAWVAALALPAYYLADSSQTLVRRILRGEKPWQAHREHAYQKAVQAGLSHTQVCLRILACNAGLVVIAVLAEQAHWAIGVAGAPLLAFGFTAWLANTAPRRGAA